MLSWRAKPSSVIFFLRRHTDNPVVSITYRAGRDRVWQGLGWAWLLGETPRAKGIRLVLSSLPLAPARKVDNRVFLAARRGDSRCGGCRQLNTGEWVLQECWDRARSRAASAVALCIGVACSHGMGFISILPPFRADSSLLHLW